jgi:hypothetical protein
MVHLLALRCVELHLSNRLAEEQGSMPCTSWPDIDNSKRSRGQARKNNMSDGRSGRKPETPGGPGIERDPAPEAEATPRSKRMAYICWNDGASNFVEPGWEWFTCWRCGALVYTA